MTDTSCNRKCSPRLGCTSAFFWRTAYQTRDAKILRGIETVGALIFDFDSVIADSEAIANSVLAEIVTQLGHSTTLD